MRDSYKNYRKEPHAMAQEKVQEKIRGKVRERGPEKPTAMAPEKGPEKPHEKAHDGCRHKATPRSAALQSDVQKRLNRAIGQLNGVKAMVDDNRYCGDVLMQLSAAESAIHRISELLLREHMETCVVEEIRAGNDEIVDEVLDLMRRFS